MSLTVRRGYLLAEALCALALAGVLAVAAATSMTGARRAVEAAEARGRSARAGREALMIIATLSRDADSVVILGDTTVELSIRIASGVVCARGSNEIGLPPVRTVAARPFTARAQPIEIGDELVVLVREDTVAPPRWVRSTVDSAAERSGGAVLCTPGTGFVDPADGAQPQARLVLDALDPGVRVGDPVRVYRRGRLALYSAGGGEWMLGWRRCRAGLCGTIQPVAGPLRSSAAGGLRFSRDTGSSELLARVRVPGIAAFIEGRVALADGW